MARYKTVYKTGSIITTGFSWDEFTYLPCDQFLCSANQHPQSTIKKNEPTNLCAPRDFSKNVSVMFDNHTILLFWLYNKQTFMFSLRDLCFVLCSLDLHALRAQRIMGLLSYLPTNQWVRKFQSHRILVGMLQCTKCFMEVNGEKGKPSKQELEQNLCE